MLEEGTVKALTPAVHAPDAANHNMPMSVPGMTRTSHQIEVRVWAGVGLMGLGADTLANIAPVPNCRAPYSSASGCSPIFFSPAAFFSLYFFIQASQLLPAAVSLPVKASEAMSA